MAERHTLHKLNIQFHGGFSAAVRVVATDDEDGKEEKEREWAFAPADTHAMQEFPLTFSKNGDDECVLARKVTLHFHDFVDTYARVVVYALSLE